MPFGRLACWQPPGAIPAPPPPPARPLPPAPGAAQPAHPGGRQLHLSTRARARNTRPPAGKASAARARAAPPLRQRAGGGWLLKKAPQASAPWRLRTAVRGNSRQLKAIRGSGLGKARSKGCRPAAVGQAPPQAPPPARGTAAKRRCKQGLGRFAAGLSGWGGSLAARPKLRCLPPAPWQRAGPRTRRFATVLPPWRPPTRSQPAHAQVCPRGCGAKPGAGLICWHGAAFFLCLLLGGQKASAHKCAAGRIGRPLRLRKAQSQATGRKHRRKGSARAAPPATARHRPLPPATCLPSGPPKHIKKDSCA